MVVDGKLMVSYSRSAIRLELLLFAYMLARPNIVMLRVCKKLPAVFEFYLNKYAS